jgi:hypothetical protein
MATQILHNLLGGQCQRCGSTTKLNIHHKDKNRKNGDISNLELLCRSCHLKVHGKVWGKKVIFTLRFPRAFLGEYDPLLLEKGYGTRAEAVREAMRDQLARWKRGK